MPLRFHNALTGRLEDFSPSKPPLISFLWKPAVAKAGPRSRSEVFVSALLDSLVYLGYGVDQAAADQGESVEIYCGESRPPRSVRIWLNPVEARFPPGASWSNAEFRYLCLRTHYRRLPDFSASAVSQAVDEFDFLRESARRLESAHAGSASSPRGVAGYKKRIRDACSRDMDFPEVLSSLRDALRPGALSPGSQREVVREVDSILGLLTEPLP